MKQAFLFVSAMLLFSAGLMSQATWVEQTSGIATSLNSVSSVDDMNVWACGDNGIVLRTTNGGTNWTNVTHLPIPVTLQLTNIFGNDANTALVTGSTATATFVYRTANGGTNWTQVFTQAGGFIDAIWMGNIVAGFMYGDPVGGRWSLWGTVNGGLTWDSTQFYLPQNGSETGWNNAFFFDPVSQAVWFGTNNTRSYRSTNLILWETQPTTTQLNSYAIWFNSGTNGMTGGTTMMYTSNSGTNWAATASPMPGTANVSGITGINSNWWVTRQDTVIYFGLNNGANWSTNYHTQLGNYNHLTKSRGGIQTLFAVRSNGGISKGTNLLTGIEPVSNDIPANYNLGQNYPNPFNPSTNIRFSLHKAEYVTIKIFDELGRVVGEPVNNRMQAGTYNVSFDASNLASGVYYYRIVAGTFISTKKMTVLK